MANAARTAAYNLLGPAAYGVFTNFHLILSTGLCGWAGLATLGGDQVRGVRGVRCVRECVSAWVTRGCGRGKVASRS